MVNGHDFNKRPDRKSTLSYRVGVVAGAVTAIILSALWVALLAVGATWAILLIVHHL